MAVTNNMEVTLVEQSQSQKEVTVNEAFARFDAILNTAAIGKDWTAPPGSPANGDVYIIGASATGDWAGHDGEIAYFDQVWKFITPKEGCLMWAADQTALFVYSGSVWNLLVDI